MLDAQQEKNVGIFVSGEIKTSEQGREIESSSCEIAAFDLPMNKLSAPVGPGEKGLFSPVLLSTDYAFLILTPRIKHGSGH